MNATTFQEQLTDEESCLRVIDVYAARDKRKTEVKFYFCRDQNEKIVAILIDIDILRACSEGLWFCISVSENAFKDRNFFAFENY